MVAHERSVAKLSISSPGPSCNVGSSTVDGRSNLDTRNALLAIHNTCKISLNSVLLLPDWWPVSITNALLK